MLSETGSLNQYFLPTWFVLSCGIYALLALTLHRHKGLLENITLIFNVFGIVLIAIGLMPLVLDQLTSQSGEFNPVDESHSDWRLSSKQASVNITQRNSGRRPDVYYIILDGYARGDVLQSEYHFNNLDFLNWLETKDFWVGSLSHSNYPWTYLSLAATLNGEYLQTLLPENLKLLVPTESRDSRKFLTAVLGKYYIKRNRTQRFFSSLGYHIFTNRSGYSITTKTPVTIIDAMKGPFNEFEQALIRRTIFKSLIELRNNRLSKYEQVTRWLDQLGTVARQDGPKFVFYHIMSPHPPFCFLENGEMMPIHPIYGDSPWLTDLEALPGYYDWIMEKYPRNILGLNAHVKTTINEIMDVSEGNAIIIIQSDHGSNSRLNLKSAVNSNIVERFGILNAIYIPADFPRFGLEKSMSSVNTFRIVLANIFGLNLPPLENHAFIPKGGLDFEEVTPELRDQTGKLNIGSN
jgi:hypothetical protein